MKVPYGHLLGWTATAAVGLALAVFAPGRPIDQGTIEGRVMAAICPGFVRPDEHCPANRPWTKATIHFGAPRVTVTAVSGYDGSYSTGLPPGTYTVDLGPIHDFQGPHQVTIGPGETETADFSFVLGTG